MSTYTRRRAAEEGGGFMHVGDEEHVRPARPPGFMTCPHCEKPFSKAALRLHVTRCWRTPDPSPSIHGYTSSSRPFVESEDEDEPVPYTSSSSRSRHTNKYHSRPEWNNEFASPSINTTSKGGNRSTKPSAPLRKVRVTSLEEEAAMYSKDFFTDAATADTYSPPHMFNGNSDDSDGINDDDDDDGYKETRGGFSSWYQFNEQDRARSGYTGSQPRGTFGHGTTRGSNTTRGGTRSTQSKGYTGYTPAAGSKRDTRGTGSSSGSGNGSGSHRHRPVYDDDDDDDDVWQRFQRWAKDAKQREKTQQEQFARERREREQARKAKWGRGSTSGTYTRNKGASSRSSSRSKGTGSKQGESTPRASERAKDQRRTSSASAVPTKPAAAALTPSDVQTIIASFTALYNPSSGTSQDTRITLDDLPCQLCHKVTETALIRCLYAQSASEGNKTLKVMIRLLHPDKFQQRIGARLEAGSVTAALQLVTALFQQIQGAKERYNPD